MMKSLLLWWLLLFVASYNAFEAVHFLRNVSKRQSAKIPGKSIGRALDNLYFVLNTLTQVDYLFSIRIVIFLACAMGHGSTNHFGTGAIF